MFAVRVGLARSGRDRWMPAEAREILLVGGTSRKLIPWLLVVVGVLVAGCAGSNAPSEASAASPETTMNDEQFAPGPMPASAMFSEYSNLMGIFHAMAEDLVAECMAREGFEYRPIPMEPWSGWGEVRSARPIRPMSVEEASESGYLVDDLLEETLPDLFDGPPEQRDAFYDALSGDETVTLDNGMTVGIGGCRGESQAEVAGDVDKLVAWLGMSGPLQNLAGAAYSAAEASADWEAALRRWRQCVNDAGIDATTQGELLTVALEGAEDLTGRPIHEQDDEPIEGKPRPTELEKQLATLDAACQQKSGIVAEWDRVLSLAEQEVVSDNPEVVIVWSDTSRQMRAAVAEVLTAIPDPGTDPATGYTVPEHPG